MQIALLGVTHPFRGGIAHHTTLLCRALRQRHRVSFFALRRQYPRLLFPGTTQRDPSRDALRVEHRACIDPVNPLSWAATFDRIRRLHPDLLLVAWWHPFFAPAFGTIAHLARRVARIPVCYLCHNVWPHESSRLDRPLLRYAYAAGDAFIVHTSRDREKLGQLVSAPVRYVPHPVYQGFFTGEPIGAGRAKERLGLAGKRVLLFFGFVRPYKGLSILLEAVQRLDPVEGYHLVVAGEFYQDRGVYRRALDALAARGQLTLIDRYLPNEEVGPLFAAADLVVAPYLDATGSGVVQLARAFGRPVAASSVGGMPGLIEDGRTGYLVPPGDPAALAAAIRRHFDSGQQTVRPEDIVRCAGMSWAQLVRVIEEIGATLTDPRRR